MAATDAPAGVLTGDTVALGPVRTELAPLFHRWLNEAGQRATGGFPEPPVPWSLERVQEWLETAARSEDPMWFVLYAVDGWRPIGFMNLRDLDWRHRTAEWAVSIGDPADRGHGYGTKAVRLLMRLAFVDLGLHNLWCDVFEFNEAGVRAYEKAGFRVLGRRREARWADGRLWDVLLMDAVASDFEGP